MRVFPALRAKPRGVRRKDVVMTAVLEAVAKEKPEPTAEQEEAEEQVRRFREQGLSLIGSEGLLKQRTRS